MTLSRGEQWACWNALLNAIADAPAGAIPKRNTLSAFAKLTIELGAPAAKRLDDRIEHERVHNVAAMYSLTDARDVIEGRQR